jgi:hypothetical protein
MTGFTYRLQYLDGSAEPELFRTATPTWRAGDTIPLRRDLALRVVEVRPATEPDGESVLVLEEAVVEVVG